MGQLIRMGLSRIRNGLGFINGGYAEIVPLFFNRSTCSRCTKKISHPACSISIKLCFKRELGSPWLSIPTDNPLTPFIIMLISSPEWLPKKSGNWRRAPPSRENPSPRF